MAGCEEYLWEHCISCIAFHNVLLKDREREREMWEALGASVLSREELDADSILYVVNWGDRYPWHLSGEIKTIFFSGLIQRKVTVWDPSNLPMQLIIP